MQHGKPILITEGKEAEGGTTEANTALQSLMPQLLT